MDAEEMGGTREQVVGSEDGSGARHLGEGFRFDAPCQARGEG